jgi:hypothetical protein
MPTSGGHARAIGDHAERGSLRYAYATAHDDTVHERDVGLGIAMDKVVEPVLRHEEVAVRIALTV